MKSIIVGTDKLIDKPINTLNPNPQMSLVNIDALVHNDSNTFILNAIGDYAGALGLGTWADKSGERKPLTPKEREKRKNRNKMAKASRKQNRQHRKK